MYLQRDPTLSAAAAVLIKRKQEAIVEPEPAVPARPATTTTPAMNRSSGVASPPPSPPAPGSLDGSSPQQASAYLNLAATQSRSEERERLYRLAFFSEQPQQGVAHQQPPNDAAYQPSASSFARQPPDTGESWLFGQPTAEQPLPSAHSAAPQLPPSAHSAGPNELSLFTVPPAADASSMSNCIEYEQLHAAMAGENSPITDDSHKPIAPPSQNSPAPSVRSSTTALSVQSTTPSAADGAQYQTQYDALQGAMIRAAIDDVNAPATSSTCGLDAASAMRNECVPRAPPSLRLSSPSPSPIMIGQTPGANLLEPRKSQGAGGRRSSFTTKAAELVNKVVRRRSSSGLPLSFGLSPTQTNVRAMERARGSKPDMSGAAEARQRIEGMWSSLLFGTRHVSVVQARFRGRRRRRQHEARLKAWAEREEKEVLRLLMLEEIFFDLDRDAGGSITADEFRTFLSYAGIITTVEARAEALRRVSKSVLSENDAAHNEDHARGKNEVNRLQFVGSCASLLQDTTDEVIVAAAKVFGAALSACERKNEVDCTLAARRIDNHAKLVLPATFVWMNCLLFGVHFGDEYGDNTLELPERQFEGFGVVKGWNQLCVIGMIVVPIAVSFVYATAAFFKRWTYARSVQLRLHEMRESNENDERLKKGMSFVSQPTSLLDALRTLRLNSQSQLNV